MNIRLELFHIGFVKVTVFDLLDILVISWVFYKLYLLMRGTRAAQMSIGLVLILITSVLASLLNMSGMKWIFDNLKTVWLIAFVIIFQPELRRLLLYIGQSPVIRFFVKVGGTRVIEEVVKAAFELSRRGYGGLMVLVRDTGIRGIIETGMSVRAEVSAPLLVSIFNPRSPLHDGAVIIQNDLVEAAKCILPLTTNPNVDPLLGTRHRAALGLSEESDAVVVVVSEETGRVSVAMDGQLIADLNHEELLRVLEEAFKVKPA